MREMEFSYQEMDDATNGFSMTYLIGKGSHGCVYKAALKGNKHVAVKRQSKGFKSFEGSNLEKEIKIIQSIHSPHIIKLLGVSKCSKTQEKLLIMELMPHGSLHELLHSSSSSSPLTWPRRAAIALQVATAVLALHEARPPVIHRDIKPDNILFDSRWRARLGDFSLAILAGGADDHELLSWSSSPPAGTIGYLDPAYTCPRKAGPKNDVYSLGVVLLELLSSRRAMDVESDPASLVAWAVPMIKARRAADVCDKRVAMAADVVGPVTRILDVAASCVSSKEVRRPTMAEVVAELRCVAEEIGSVSRYRRIYRCVRAWRRRATKRVTTATTTKIVCKDHLTDDDNDEEDDDENKR